MSTVPAPTVAVVGHVEWVEFATVDRVPAAGEIAHAGPAWGVAAGGGAVAAVQLARLAGTARLFTVLGEDRLGQRCLDELTELGVEVCAARRGVQRRALTLVDAAGERTITTLGPKLAPGPADDLPWDLLARCDAVFFVAGAPEVLRAARMARRVTATTRALSTLEAARVGLDAVIGSGRDPAERYPARALDPAPAAVIRTDGARGGSYETADGRSGAWPAARPPGKPIDSYGCGDSFAAGVTFGVARGEELEAAISLGARCGAACLTGRGPYAAQLGAADDL
ncbi:MAG: ribokinase [Thermoleophilaceae bacterium]|nr:ribokinase [Thermoleophilaceae bacterium]